MPDISDFLFGFGLLQNKNYSGYTLINILSSHDQIIRYREYLYHIEIIFRNTGSGSYETLYSTINNLIMQEHIINSRYGNPYRCIIDPIKYGDILQDSQGNIIFKLTGHSYRI